MRTKNAKSQNGEKVVEANRFELVDSDGRVHARLGMICESGRLSSKKGPKLTMFGTNGQERISISFIESLVNGRYGEGANIRLYDREGHQRVWLRTMSGIMNPQGETELLFTEHRGGEAVLLKPQLYHLANLPWGEKNPKGQPSKNNKAPLQKKNKRAKAA